MICPFKKTSGTRNNNKKKHFYRQPFIFSKTASISLSKPTESRTKPSLNPISFCTSTGISEDLSWQEQLIRSKPYTIPLRSLIAKDVDGLLLAGRCISGDFIAHSSYRVTGPVTTIGQAAGRAAAVSSKKKKLPQEIKFSEYGFEEI